MPCEAQREWTAAPGQQGSFLVALLCLATGPAETAAAVARPPASVVATALSARYPHSSLQRLESILQRGAPENAVALTRFPTLSCAHLAYLQPLY